MSDVSIQSISVEELVAVFEAAAAAGESVALVDVRELDEWVDGHAAAAAHIPLGTVHEHLDAFGDDDTAQPTYVICKSGGRSFHACEFAAAQGKNVVNVAGGMMAWVQAGHDVKVGN